jgi:hypothetical protein
MTTTSGISRTWKEKEEGGGGGGGEAEEGGGRVLPYRSDHHKCSVEEICTT